MVLSLLRRMRLSTSEKTELLVIAHHLFSFGVYAAAGKEGACAWATGNLCSDCSLKKWHSIPLAPIKDEKYMGATPGIVSILHTNGQDLNFHPHIHNIVSGGGINAAGKWTKEKRSNGRFLFPRRSMEKIYKGYFLDQLRKYIAKGLLKYTDSAALESILHIAGHKKWNVHANAPFGCGQIT